MKLAILHDYLRPVGGYSQVAVQLAKTLNAPIYTINSELKNPGVEIREIGTGLIKRLKGLFQFYSCLKFENTKLRDYDIIVSSGNYSKSYIPLEHQTHINMCYTPTRAVTDLAYISYGFPLNYPMSLYVLAMGVYDQACLNRVDKWIAISKHIQHRIKKYYNRESTVIYPPVDTKRFSHKQSEGYYLHVGRLHQTKRIIPLIRAFRILGPKWKLKIVGTGPLEKKLRKEASGCSNIEFTGYVERKQLIDLYSHCEATLFNAQSEDFGLVPVESNACGKPCIAINEGATSETIKDLETGVLYKEPTANGILDAFASYNCMRDKLDHKAIMRHAQQFDVSVFNKKIKQLIKHEGSE